MRTVTKMMGAAITFALLGAPPIAEAATPAFAVAPESDAALGSITGTWQPSYTARLLIQDDATRFLQQSGQVSRLQMDNWWATTGADLIGANLLMQR